MPTPRNKIYSAKILSVKNLAPDVREIKIIPDEAFSFIPGEYVWLELPNLSAIDPRGNRRAFSISSYPSPDNSISIIGRLGTSGYKQTLFALKEGDLVKVHGPFGSLQFPSDPATPVICIAGGVGIAPFLSLIPGSTAHTPDRKITLVSANRAGEENVYSPYFGELKGKNPALSVVEVKGRISPETLTGLHATYPGAAWVIVGPREMVYAVAKALYDLGIEEDRLIFDEFYVTKNSLSIVESKNFEADLKGLFPVAMNQASNHVILTDIDGFITFANTAAEKITGYSFSEMQGQTPRLWGGLESPEFYKKMWQTIKNEKKPFVDRIVNRRKNGDLYYVIAHITPLTDSSGELMGFMGTEEDITRLIEIDRMKTEFVSLASHQLRTPLTAIKWGLEIFSDDSTNLSDKQKEYLKDINNSTLRMIDLVNSLLNISRIESGRIIVNPQPTNIVKLANDVIGKLKLQLTNKNIALVMDVPTTLPEIALDYNLIFNVFQNLITNAISYSPPGSKVTISIISKDGEIISSVKDEGIGIPDQEKARIYSKFYRASNAIKEHPDGNGLGLYLVRSIVESSGGKVWFDSIVGKGTTFYFSLPTTGMKAKEGEVTLS